jgi:sulfonate transport system substrate-binding protein
LQKSLRDSGLDVKFHWYQEGRMLHGAIDNNEINVVGTGSTRAIKAQADDVPITYIAASQPRTTGAAILVLEDSAIKSPADLAGKRVGLIDGSFHTYFLVAALDAAGVPYASVKAINWAVKDTQRALREGEVDAWVAMAPYLAPAVADGGLRKLIGVDAVFPNRSVFWVHKSVSDQGRHVVEALAQSFAATDRWIGADPRRAAQLFVKAIGNVSEEGWTVSVASRKWGLVDADATVLAEQQAEADVLARHGLLAKKIDLQEAALDYPLNLERKVAA